MKKQNILDLLCDDLVLEINTKIENFDKCIDDFDKCVDNNIIPFLIERHEEFGFKFDLNSTDIAIKEKSESILGIMIREFRELISITPDYFLAEKEENGFDIACNLILGNILMGNDIKELFNL